MAGYGFRLEAARPDERLKRHYSVKSEDVEMTPSFSTNLFPEHLPALQRFHLVKPKEPAEPSREEHGLASSSRAKINSDADDFDLGEDGSEVPKRISVLEPEPRLSCASPAALAESTC